MHQLRSVLTATAAVIVGLSFTTTEAVAASKLEWNLSAWGNPRAVTRGMERFAEYVEEASGGNLTIKIAYGETLSPARQNLDAVSIGAFEMAQTCTSYHPGKNRIGTVLDLPFLPIEDLDVQAQVHQSFHREYEPWREEMANWNAIVQFSSLLPQYEFMGRGTPPRKLEDWRGMRVRALGGLGDAMRKLDVVPTTVPAPEVYTAVERGVIQAAAFPYSYTFGAYRLHEIGQWFTSNIAIGAVHCPNVIHSGSLEELSPELRRILDEAVEPAYEALKVAYTEADARWIPIYQERMEEIRFTAEELAAFRDAAGQPVWDEWVAQMEADGLPGRETLDFVLDRAHQAVGGS